MDTQNHNESSAHKNAEPKSQLQGLEGFFDTYLREKAPFQLPHGAREWIVKYGPWISLVFLIIGAFILIPVLMIALGLTAVTLPYQAMAGTVGTTAFGWLGIILSLVVIVMEAMAIPALMKRKMSGWKLLYFAFLLSAVSQIITMNIIGFILSLLIGMYILFQIRSFYK